MQNGLDRESSSLQDLDSQKQDAQERLEEMDQQRSKLEGMLNDIKQKCQEESHMVRDGVIKARNAFYFIGPLVMFFGIGSMTPDANQTGQSRSRFVSRTILNLITINKVKDGYFKYGSCYVFSFYFWRKLHAY